MACSYLPRSYICRTACKCGGSACILVYCSIRTYNFWWLTIALGSAGPLPWQCFCLQSMVVLLQVLWPKKGAFDNVNDLKEQAFYRFIANTYWGHIVAQFAILYAIGGWPWFVWLGCIRVSHSLSNEVFVSSMASAYMWLTKLLLMQACWSNLQICQSIYVISTCTGLCVHCILCLRY